MPKKYFTCSSCGETVECSEEDRPCEVLDGWLMVSRLKGREAVDHYNFCSLICLRTWLNSQIPQVPEAFLKAFEKEEKD